MQISEVLDHVYAIVRQVREGPVALAPDTELLTVGIDSLAIVRVVLQCEELFGIDLEPEDLVTSRLMTPHAIATLLLDKYGVRTLAAG